MLLMLVFALSAVVFADETGNTDGEVTAAKISSQLCQFRALIVGILPTIVLITFLLAGLIYIAGQTFGAEMKSRAQNWAMSLIAGGIIGMTAVVVAPLLVDICWHGKGLYQKSMR